MNYNISVSVPKTYIRIQVNEPVTKESLQGFIGEAAEKSKECGIDNFLFDLRCASNQTGMIHHYEFVYDLSKQLGFKPLSKHALLVSQKGMLDYNFVETILINAGYKGKLFTDESAAIEWLDK